ncbi:hypothetical protein FRB90_005587 [Tulasnella sp. 427]|nr:hypothetical protein FRB90_005587 [Tulasnella sp. 427]
MKLGGTRTGSLVDELVEEAAPAGKAPGGWDDDGDLIDVSADTGDWSEFAKAPDAPELEAVHDPDAWGDMLDSSSKPTSPAPPPAAAAMPNLSTFAPAPRKAPATPAANKIKSPSTPQPKTVAASLAPPIHQQSRSPSLPNLSRAMSDNRTSSPAPAAVTSDDWGDDDSTWKADDPGSTTAATPATPMAAMSKEEKAAEMARRREERKQRIAQLKEQKKKG